jgi:hypothetical protein
MSASKAQQAATAERRAKACAMRLAGADWQTIADALGYSSRGAAHTDVTRSLKANRKAEAGQAEELRQLTVARYDRLQAAFWPKALKGDPKAAEVVLKCLAGRAKIEGVDAPAKVEHSGQVVTYEINGVDLDQLK